MTNNLTIRTISGGEELDLFCRLPYSLNGNVAGDLQAGRRHPEWMWVALQGDRLVARAAWWSRAGDQVPMYLDILDLDQEHDGRIDIGVKLMETALAAVVPAGGKPPEYLRFIRPDWRDDPTAHRVMTECMAVLERTGAQLFVERLNLLWLPGTPIPAPSGRLAFREFQDPDEFIALTTLVLDGTLDAHSREQLTHMTARQAATENYEEEFTQYRSPREWWRVAILPDGEPVGFVVPARNPYSTMIGYIGVLPAHRGNGYIDDILAEGTRILAAEGTPRITASTDVGNVPMAAAFARCGYDNPEREVCMTWS